MGALPCHRTPCMQDAPHGLACHSSPRSWLRHMACNTAHAGQPLASSLGPSHSPCAVVGDVSASACSAAACSKVHPCLPAACSGITHTKRMHAMRADGGTHARIAQYVRLGLHRHPCTCLPTPVGLLHRLLHHLLRTASLASHLAPHLSHRTSRSVPLAPQLLLLPSSAPPLAACLAPRLPLGRAGGVRRGGASGVVYGTGRPAHSSLVEAGASRATSLQGARYRPLLVPSVVGASLERCVRIGRVRTAGEDGGTEPSGSVGRIGRRGDVGRPAPLGGVDETIDGSAARARVVAGAAISLVRGGGAGASVAGVERGLFPRGPRGAISRGARAATRPRASLCLLSLVRRSSRRRSPLRVRVLRRGRP